MTVSVNPLGCSPRALRAVRLASMDDIRTYPDASPLLSALAGAFGISPDCICLGAGSEQLIKLVSQTFLAPGDTVVVESGSFFLFSREPELTGATVLYRNFSLPQLRMKKPSLLFLANPTTPGGINRSNEQLLAILDGIRPAVAIIDEANGEFRSDSMISEITRRDNIIVLRTFSKGWGLAGLRIGFAAGSPRLIAKLNERQQPFPVTSLAIAAAVASLSDTRFLAKTVAFTASERKFLTAALGKRGFDVSPSVTGNLYVSRPDSKRVIRELERRGVSVIDGTYFPGMQDPGFRISLRDKLTNRKFLAALDQSLACLNRKKLIPSKEDL